MSHYHFFWQEQNQIFLPTADWLATYFTKPAWLACMAGEYLTQYYYYKWAGPVILAVITLCTVFMAYVALRKASGYRWGGIAVATLTLFWIVACSLNPAYRLASVLCITGAFALYLLARPLRLWTWALIPLVYWLFGYGSIIYTALCIIGVVLTHTRIPLKALLCTACVAVALLTPAIFAGVYSLPYTKSLTYPDIGKPSAYDKEWVNTVAMECEYYFGNYDRALDLALNAETPNQINAFYYYLINAKRDSLPDVLLKYPLRDLGTLNTIGDTTPLPIINMMNDLYYECGDMMYAERAAMMRCVFSSHNRNARMLKRLAETNLVSADTLAAMKYLRILSKMPAYSKWAADHTPSTMSDPVRREIEYRRSVANKKADLRLGDNFRYVLLELLESNPKNTVALDYLLCTDLLLKQIDTFKMDYDRYCMDEGVPRVKPLYQQALMIYLAGTEASADVWDKYVEMPDVLSRFYQYSRNRGNDAFADTYWYYFDSKNQ